MKKMAVLMTFVTSLLAACALDEGRLAADTVLSLATTADGQPTRTLPAGVELKVKRCVDAKHYIVPEIVDEFGDTYYVVDGEFHFVDNDRAWGC